MNNNIIKIGIFDSGVGGLNILADLIRETSNIEYYYFGDTKHFPYGTKTKNALLKYITNIVRQFHKMDINIVLIACNTASAIAKTYLKVKFPTITFIDIVQLTVDFVRPIIKDNILILSSKQTAKCNIYRRMIKKISKSSIIHQIICTRIIYLIENMPHTTKLLNYEIQKIFSQIDIQNYQIILMACTHFKQIDILFNTAFKRHSTKFIYSNEAIVDYIYTNYSYIKCFNASKAYLYFTGQIPEAAYYLTNELPTINIRNIGV